ncbi:MAG: patatin-like phospholipase family protein [Planctomycetota bacterium]
MFRILSLDGGGIKGAFSASVLAALERDTGKAAVDDFDLNVGTSTGGMTWTRWAGRATGQPGTSTTPGSRNRPAAHSGTAVVPNCLRV